MQGVETEIALDCSGLDVRANENLMEAESKGGQDILKESALSVVALDLVSGGEGGSRGAVPHLFVISGLGLDSSGSVLIMSASSDCSFHICVPSAVVGFPLDPYLFFVRRGQSF